MHLKLYLTIRGQQHPDTKVVQPIKGPDIKRALLSVWQFHDWHIAESSVVASGQDYLNDAKYAYMKIHKTIDDADNIEKLLDYLSTVIWQTNGEYCHIRISATLKTDHPLEIHKSSPEQFARVMGFEPVIIEREADEIRISS